MTLSAKPSTGLREFDFHTIVFDPFSVFILIQLAMRFASSSKIIIGSSIQAESLKHLYIYDWCVQLDSIRTCEPRKSNEITSEIFSWLW